MRLVRARGHPAPTPITAPAHRWALIAAALITLACNAFSAGPTITPILPTDTPDPPTQTPAPTATLTPTPDPRASIIGYSVLGRPIEAYRIGLGPVPLILIGGIHGGYEWNTVLLANELIVRSGNGSIQIPPHLSIYVIPAANPDGLAAVTHVEGDFTPDDVTGDTTAGRTNALGVDLNRNWDCNWQPEAEWRGGTVSAGSKAFSEPETRALRDFIEEINPAAVVFWHSAANGVFAGGCGGKSAYEKGRQLALQYARAAGYGQSSSGEAGSGRFTAYPITGDAANWVSLRDIPALDVELQSHDHVEFDENWRGLQTLFAALAP